VDVTILLPNWPSAIVTKAFEVVVPAMNRWTFKRCIDKATAASLPEIKDLAKPALIPKPFAQKAPLPPTLHDPSARSF